MKFIPINFSKFDGKIPKGYDLVVTEGGKPGEDTLDLIGLDEIGIFDNEFKNPVYGFLEIEKSVEVGTTVELDIDTNKIQKVNTMKNSKENQKVVEKIVNRKATKSELVEMIKKESVFAGAKKDLLKVANFMSLKKQMLSLFPEEMVKEAREKLPKIERKPRAAKTTDPLIEAITNAEKDELKSISKENEKFAEFEWKPLKKDVEKWRSAMLNHLNPPKAEKPAPKEDPNKQIIHDLRVCKKVKELKAIAKEDEHFNWKELKKLDDFDKIASAMLTIVNPPKPKPVVKMVKNPLIAEVAAFTKAKKLWKWTKEKPEFAMAEKSKDLHELQVNLLALIPAEIKEKPVRRTAIRNWPERKEAIEELIKEGKWTRPEILAKLKEKFPDHAKANGNVLSECKNPERWEKFGRLSKFVEVNKKGKMRFAK